jgi:UDP-N-acetylmuramate--alanine ligase
VHVIFQPHRYTRTRDLMAEFATAFDEADTVQVLDIYAASEEPIGVDARLRWSVPSAVRVQYAASFEEAISRTVAQAKDGDVIVTLGAGSVSQAAGMVLEALGSTVQSAVWRTSCAHA